MRWVENNFSESQTKNCELLIRIGEGEFSFAVVDKDQSRIKAIAEVSGSLEGGFSNEPLLAAGYSATKVAFETFDFTFIPEELFKEADVASYARFINDAGEKQIVVTDQKSTRIRQVAGIEKGAFQAVHRVFTNPLIFTQADALIEAAFQINSAGDTKLFLNFNSTKFEALIAEAGSLKFYNSFKIETADDFNYFLLLLLQEQKLYLTNPVCFISGDIETGDEYYNRLTKYFNQVEFSKPELNLPVSENIIPSRFFSLIGLSQCE